jgi:hypothetical protein
MLSRGLSLSLLAAVHLFDSPMQRIVVSDSNVTYDEHVTSYVDFMARERIAEMRRSEQLDDYERDKPIIDAAQAKRDRKAAARIRKS